MAETKLQLFCPTCGYNVNGLPEDTCPECGNAFDRDELIRRRKQGTLSDKELLLRFFVPPVVFVALTGVLAIATNLIGSNGPLTWMMRLYLLIVGTAAAWNAVKLGLAVDFSGRTVLGKIDRQGRNYFTVVIVAMLTLVMQAAIALLLGCGCFPLLMLLSGVEF